LLAFCVGQWCGINIFLKAPANVNKYTQTAQVHYFSTGLPQPFLVTGWEANSRNHAQQPVQAAASYSQGSTVVSISWWLGE